MLKYTEQTLVVQRFMMRQKLVRCLKTLTRPLVQRLVLLALSALVAMCLGESLLFQTVHPLTPALSTIGGVLLVSDETHAWGPAYPAWKGGLI